MKKIFLLLVLQSTFCILHSKAQVGEWVWIHGSSGSNSPGNFGTQGVPASTNEPPGLYEACEWIDHQGNLWFYGGLDNIAGIKIHNDLWRYNTSTAQWTWMTGTHAYNDTGVSGVRGVPLATNRPPSIGFGASSWVDTQGNLWMFGGTDSNSTLGSQSNLWKYDIATNIWTWINGPGYGYHAGVYGNQGIPDTANYPGGRSEVPTAWVDNNGDFWMFGGYSGGDYSDMWKYNIASNSWTWMKGPNTTNQNGSWGAMGVEIASNMPGARRTYSHWKDNAGNLWMFAGLGRDASGTSGWYLSDLWRYNPLNNNWTWMNGSPFGSNTFMGTYGTKCVTDPSNQPPPRFEDRASWTDANGNFWVFGGFYRTSPFNSFDINDLWMYCVANNEWTWEGGANTPNTAGNWGTLNVSSPSNIPSPRMGCSAWSDRNGHLYLFGGSNGGFGTFYNDLWKFTIDPACGSCPQSLPTASFTSSDTVFCDENGRCISFTDHSTGSPFAWQWLFPGANPDTSSMQNPDSICYTIPGTYNVTLIVTNSAGTDTLNAASLIILATAPLPPTVTVFGGDTLKSSHGASYQWYKNGFPIAGATDSFYVAMQGGTYSVRISDGNGCSAISSGVVISGLSEFSSADEIEIYPNPARDEINIVGLKSGIETTLEINNVLGEVISTLKLSQNINQETVNVSRFANGIYFLKIAANGRTINKKFVILHN